MKKHIVTFSVGALLVPIALSIAAAVANEAQTLLGLNLDRVSLAIYLLPFLAGAAAAIAALLRLEAAKIGGDLGGLLGDLVTDMFGPPPAKGEDPIAPVVDAGAKQIEGGQLPPPPPPPPAP